MKKLAWKDGNLHERVVKCRIKLVEAQKARKKNPHDKDLKAKKAVCLTQYADALADEESLLFQQAKLEWISKGDRNNKYFHKILKSITSVCNEGRKFRRK
ncbi:RNA-directed DNA polymerase, eukaryota, Reverse transcriptase zinc-binding domain protein [Artemisia annua]|uniref:RNA-directed DNA polymerase, eukaryota, Reverse transcriptase zinc-binding domain protein n=1 Tax=Artemisia annua TaxID=35608 RepID=A0A2U1PHR0_ARTAN|nr:RNA-directed DNA polymerase, eukaryota, Reverse transcriptase zinc-binding domain protein [Artemisia annua]